MKQQNKKKQEQEPNLIWSIGNLTCGKCQSSKFIVLGINYFDDGQIILNLFCDVCGTISPFPLFEEGKPTDVRVLTLQNLKEKQDKEKKK